MRINEIITESNGNGIVFYRGEPILSPERLTQLKNSIGKPYPIFRQEGSKKNIGTYMSPKGQTATNYVTQALAGQGRGGAVTKIAVDPNSFKNGDGGIDEAVIISNIAGLVSNKDPDPKDPLRINDRKRAMEHYLGPGVKKYLNDPLFTDPKLVKTWYNPKFAKKAWDTIKSGQQAVTKPGENSIEENMIKILSPVAEKIRRDPEVIKYFLSHDPGDWVEYNFRMNSDGSGTQVLDVKYFPPAKEKVSEDIAQEELDLDRSGVQYHNTLNPKFWRAGRLDPEVRTALLDIADKFIGFLNIEDLAVEDIVLTGSMANYNWTKFSDFDLHIVVDYSTVDCDLAEELFRAKKDLWNSEHDITISGYDVELYVEDTAQPPVSQGVYSLNDDAWLKKPSYDPPKFNDAAIDAKASGLMQDIDRLIDSGADDPEEYQRISDKIARMRRAGLDSAGEFSTENLAFKVLRNLDYLGKLKRAKRKSLDISLSKP